MLEHLQYRPRRLRKNSHIRNLVHEVDLSLHQLIQPYFLKEGSSTKEPISGFTDVYRWGVDSLSKKIETDLELGLSNFLLFGEVSQSQKGERGLLIPIQDSVMPKAIQTLKNRFGDKTVLFVDVCLCPFTSHGACGVLNDGSNVKRALGNNMSVQVDNDATVTELSKIALCYAQAGADFVAPSDMMDGRVGAIRRSLDQQGLNDTGILAYTAKYASSYYGPFREALGSSPVGMDRASYQMDYRNSKEALRELDLDVKEGADMVMVKPALAYLDIISLFHRSTKLPVVAYSVSGEYEMVKQLAKIAMADERKMAIENLTAIRRSGADTIITYYASEIAEKRWL